MKTVTLAITGMTCGHCAGSVQNVLDKLDGVQQAEINLGSKQAQVTYDENKTSPAQMIQAISDIGFSAAV